ncbi:dnaJ homolog subfamily B member 4-like [Telopea speciosissima]|uniref:dnaJ homolog subfamily B member 4-like n=1 Tax=Telopea speciosissima TaxID=54955 RepID=UPI001CC7B961|nr:dnaJ homolog subfamily B member 4-like [Telopea speciosissima]
MFHTSNGDGVYTTRDADGIFRQFFGDGFSGQQRKIRTIERNLPFTLEELYCGTKRKMQISRIVPNSYGKLITVEEILTVDTKAGWKKGTKITFPEKGNQDPGTIAGDLIFVVDEKSHPVYTRDGNDLLVNQKISLLDALTGGKTLNLTTLDGRNLSIPLTTNIIKPGDEIVIKNEGMPISKVPGKKGNLKIIFNVKFPSKLTEEQKSDVRRALELTMI